MKIAITLILIFFSFESLSQVKEEWEVKYNGVANDTDRATSIGFDKQGNVYVAGISKGDGTGADYLIIKYDHKGVEQWVQRYNGDGNGNELLGDLAIDENDNIYITGSSFGTDKRNHITTIKFNSSGNQEWISKNNIPSRGWAIKVDEMENVYVTGICVTQNTKSDIITIKYNSEGLEEWVQTYDGKASGEDWANTISCDNDGNIYVGGNTLSSENNSNFITIKYNSSGVLEWAKEYDGPGNPYKWDRINEIVTDNTGNVYVTGGSMGNGTGYDFLTVKYDSKGNEKWVKRQNGTSSKGTEYDTDEPFNIEVDNECNVYLSGKSMGVGNSADILTVKYDSSGSIQWLKRLKGGSSLSWRNSLIIDANFNCFVSGVIKNDEDSNYQCFIVKYDQAGNQKWIHKYKDKEFDKNIVTACCIDELGNIWITGDNITVLNGIDIFTLKCSQVQE
jgi:hypothetical protein